MTEQLLRGLQERYAGGTLKPNDIDSSGLSLLHQAALNGQLICMKYLVSCGGDLKSRSSEGLASAHYAASVGHLSIIQYMYEKDQYCISVQNEKGITPLYIAAQEGQLDCLIWLNKYTSTQTTTTDGMTPSHVAAQEGCLDCLRYLLRVNRVEGMKDDKYGCSPIHYAAAEGHWRVVKWLIEHCNVNGEDQTCTGQTTLHLAAIGCHASVVEVLLKCDVSVGIKDNKGKTALDYASGSQECYQLLEKKIDVEYDSAFDSSEKKVRFNEMVYTYDTFPHYHHTLSENKRNRRKERSGIFWDEDLQAEFDTWRSSPQLTKRKRPIVQQPFVNKKIYKGRSKHLSNLEVKKASDKKSYGDTSYESISKNLDPPDILKNLNDKLDVVDKAPPPKVPTRNGAPKLTKNEKAKLKQNNIYNSLKRYHSIDIGEAFSSMYENYEFSNNSFSSQTSAFSTNKGQAGEKAGENNNINTYKKPNNKNNNTENISSSDRASVSSNAHGATNFPGLSELSLKAEVKTQQKTPPAVPVRKNSSNLKRFVEMYPNDNLVSPVGTKLAEFSNEQIIQPKHSSLKSQTSKENFSATPSTGTLIEPKRSSLKSNKVSSNNVLSPVGNRSSTGFPNGKPIERKRSSLKSQNYSNENLVIPGSTAEGNPIVQKRFSSKSQKYSNQHLLSPVVPNSSEQFSDGNTIVRKRSRSRSQLRYRDMGECNNEEDRIVYDATSYIPPSPGFNEKFQGGGKSLSTADLSQEHLQPSFTNYLKELENDPKLLEERIQPFSENLISKKKVGKKSLFKSVSSFFNTVRQKKQSQFSTNTLPSSVSSNGAPKRGDIFTRFSVPRSRDQREFNDLFHSSASGLYKLNLETVMITTPQQSPGKTRRKGLSKNNNTGIKPPGLDTSLTGTNTLVKELEKQHSFSSDYFAGPNLNIGRLKETSSVKKERVNAFIW